MFRFCRRNVDKLYTIFVGIITVLIVTDIIHLTASPYVLKARQSDRGFEVLKFSHVQNNTTNDLIDASVFVQIKGARIYLFSALIVNQETRDKLKDSAINSQASSIVKISGWEYKQDSFTDFTCCYMLNNGTVISDKSSSKVNWLYLGKAKLQAKQFKCPVSTNGGDIEMVSLTYDNATCPKDRNFYIIATTINPNFNREDRNHTKIGVCMKLSFGSLEARRLLEWFEVHRLFGVDKIITYKYNLNEMATKVLDFYVKMGVAEVYDFDLPEKGVIKRDVGVKNMQAWNDEQIVLFDCQERLRHYDYVAVVDSDEFITPSTLRFANAWRTFMNKKFRGTNIAGVMFSSQIHADTWGPTHANHSLHIGRYNNCTLPMFDRVKSVYMPSRVQQGTVSTHSFKPLTGYKRGTSQTKEAIIHHFRGCRGEWLKQQRKENITERNYLYNKKIAEKCYDLKRTPSNIMGKLSNAVKNRVMDKIQEIGV